MEGIRTAKKDSMPAVNERIHEAPPPCVYGQFERDVHSVADAFAVSGKQLLELVVLVEDEVISRVAETEIVRRRKSQGKGFLTGGEHVRPGIEAKEGDRKRAEVSRFDRAQVGFASVCLLSLYRRGGSKKEKGAKKRTHKRTLPATSGRLGMKSMKARNEERCAPYSDAFFGTSTVGERGQVVIPAEARAEMGFQPGDKVLIMRHPIHKGLVIFKLEAVKEFLDEFSRDLKKLETEKLQPEES